MILAQIAAWPLNDQFNIWLEIREQDYHFEIVSMAFMKVSVMPMAQMMIFTLIEVVKNPTIVCT